MEYVHCQMRSEGLKGRSARLYYVQPMKDTTVSLKIEKALKAKLIALARAENRSLSNFIEGILKKEISNRTAKIQKAELHNR